MVASQNSWRVQPSTLSFYIQMPRGQKQCGQSIVSNMGKINFEYGISVTKAVMQITNMR